MDQSAKTFTIAGKEKSRTFKITERSTVTKAGASATIKDVAEGDEVRGSYWKGADGSLEVKTLKIGPVSADEKAPSSSKGKQKSGSGDQTSSTDASASPSPSPKKK